MAVYRFPAAILSLPWIPPLSLRKFSEKNPPPVSPPWARGPCPSLTYMQSDLFKIKYLNLIYEILFDFIGLKSVSKNWFDLDKEFFQSSTIEF